MKTIPTGSVAYVLALVVTTLIGLNAPGNAPLILRPCGIAVAPPSVTLCVSSVLLEQLGP
jgi:hypothetical protein